jgi:hypothetical protein
LLLPLLGKENVGYPVQTMWQKREEDLRSKKKVGGKKMERENKIEWRVCL